MQPLQEFWNTCRGVLPRDTSSFLGPLAHTSSRKHATGPRVLNSLWLSRYSTWHSAKDSKAAQIIASWFPGEDDTQRPLQPEELPLEKNAILILTRYRLADVLKLMLFWKERRP
ncbi:hypothetical protein CYMTET_32335, partial [Cymbomonas tetramitiformis]